MAGSVGEEAGGTCCDVDAGRQVAPAAAAWFGLMNRVCHRLLGSHCGLAAGVEVLANMRQRTRLCMAQGVCPMQGKHVLGEFRTDGQNDFDSTSRCVEPSWHVNRVLLDAIRSIRRWEVPFI